MDRRCNARADRGTTGSVVEWSIGLHADRHAALADHGANSSHRELTMDVSFPYGIDSSGRTAAASLDDHVRDMIEQILFTTPGERVNCPDFGTGLRQLVFAPNSDELAATLQMVVRGALQQWLGERVLVNDVTATSFDSTLTVTVKYTVLLTQESVTAEFTRAV
jgi:uncharacterized protein